ncbi:MAG: chromate transporter [Clostridia bacterium]|nr:chromate transporter [Clostridia bacterium]
MKKLLSLFITFFKIGLFTFGGGYAMISLIESETVSKKGWLNADELLEIVAVAESTPGPIAINCATYVGYKRAGVLGSFFATLGVVLPSFLIIFAISFFIDEFLKIELVASAFKGIQAAVVVLILRAGLKMLKKAKKNFVSIVLLVFALGVTITFNLIGIKISSIYLILVGGVVGFFYYTYSKDQKEKQDTLPKQNDNCDKVEAVIDNDELNAQSKEESL